MVALKVLASVDVIVWLFILIFVFTEIRWHPGDRDAAKKQLLAVFLGWAWPILAAWNSLKWVAHIAAPGVVGRVRDVLPARVIERAGGQLSVAQEVGSLSEPERE